MWARLNELGAVAEITDIDPYGRFHPDIEWLECDEAVLPGWICRGGVFSPPPDPAPYVPASITRRQGRLALLDAGLLDTVEAAISTIADPTEKRAAEIEYEADRWERSNAFLTELWAQLGNTEAELDALFVAAATK